MGLRCLIGHDYGEPETSRERDDRGNEVVVTIQEFKECSRCGERRVISENTEIRATEPAPEPEPEPEATAEESEFEDVTAAEDDGVILDDGTGERAPGEWPDEEEPEPVEAPEEWPDEEEPEPVEVHDEQPDTADGEVDGEGTEEPGGWPEHEAEDEGIDAAAPPDAAADVAFGDDPAPAADAHPTDAAAEPESGDVEATDEGAGPAGIRSAASGPDPTDQRVAGVGARFVCPECGHEVEAVETSLRPGDICPECQRGYLSEDDG